MSLEHLKDKLFTGTTLIYVGEILHFVLAIIDLWSDGNLVISIQDTLSKYEINQGTIDSLSESNQYPFDECISTNSTSPWKNETSTYCNCLQFDVECDDEQYTIDEAQLFQNSTDGIATDYVKIAHLHVPCTEDKIWQCSICQCIGDQYDKQRSFPLMQAIQEYNKLGDNQIQYCDPDGLLTDGYNDQLNDIIIVAWFFLIIGSLVQCCTIGHRAVLACDAVKSKEVEKMSQIQNEDDSDSKPDANLRFQLFKMLTAWTVCM